MTFAPSLVAAHPSLRVGSLKAFIAWAALGMEARSMPPAEFQTYVRSEIAKWAKVVKAADVTPCS